MIFYLLALLTTFLLACSYLRRETRFYNHLIELKNSMALEETTEINWQDNNFSLKNLTDYLGRAGFINPKERANAIFLIAFIILGVSLTITCFLLNNNFVYLIFIFLISAYLTTCLSLLFFKHRAKYIENRILFEIPIFLESLILLVESGLGILPAIEKCLQSKKQDGSSQLYKIFDLIYCYSSSGMTFSKALETLANIIPYRVLQHVLLHLDISNSEGGEIIPSLRSLSDHAHKEWNLSVEQRVKKLENLVVFPVFTSVIGLMLLIVAVPIVPLLELKKTLDNSTQIQTPETNNFDYQFKTIK